MSVLLIVYRIVAVFILLTMLFGIGRRYGIDPNHKYRGFDIVMSLTIIAIFEAYALIV